MIVVTLTQTENGSAVATPECNLVYGSDWWDENLNQFEIPTVDGVDAVYNGAGPILTHGSLILKNLSYADGQELIAWIRDEISFAYSRFTISAVANTDLGKGKNTAVTNARYDAGSTLNGIYEYVAPGIYNFNNPYRFVRS